MYDWDKNVFSRGSASWNCVTRSQLVYRIDSLHETGRDHVLIAAVHRHNKFIFFATPFPQKHETRERRPGLPCTRRPCACVCVCVSSRAHLTLPYPLTSMTSRSHEFVHTPIKWTVIRPGKKTLEIRGKLAKLQVSLMTFYIGHFPFCNVICTYENRGNWSLMLEILIMRCTFNLLPGTD